MTSERRWRYQLGYAVFAAGWLLLSVKTAGGALHVLGNELFAPAPAITDESTTPRPSTGSDYDWPLP